MDDLDLCDLGYNMCGLGKRSSGRRGMAMPKEDGGETAAASSCMSCLVQPVKSAKVSNYMQLTAEKNKEPEPKVEANPNKYYKPSDTKAIGSSWTTVSYAVPEAPKPAAQPAAQPAAPSTPQPMPAAYPQAGFPQPAYGAMPMMGAPAMPMMGAPAMPMMGAPAYGAPAYGAPAMPAYGAPAAPAAPAQQVVMPAKPAEVAATDDAAADDGTALDATDEVIDAAEADLAEMDSAAAVQEAVEEVVEEVPLTKEERY